MLYEYNKANYYQDYCVILHCSLITIIVIQIVVENSYSETTPASLFET